MATPKLTPDQVAQVSELVAEYISEQRKKYAPRPVPLSAQQRAPLEPFFAQEVLDRVRVLVLHGERLPNPEFYPMLRGLAFKNLPDQAAMGGITFCDVVVSHDPFSAGLLFHELVHVEQYRQLGSTRPFIAKSVSFFSVSRCTETFSSHPFWSHANTTRRKVLVCRTGSSLWYFFKTGLHFGIGGQPPAAMAYDN